MTTSKRSNAGTKTSKTRGKSKKDLEDENEQLRETVERLKTVNAQQVQRIVEQELLKIRIKELEQQLNRKSDE